MENACAVRFRPVPNGSFPDKEDMVYEEGTTYLVCCWVLHFGHVFVQMMVSAVHALVNVGFEDVLRSGSMKFLIDVKGKQPREGKHGTIETTSQVFQFVTGDAEKVQYLQDLETSATKQGKSSLCFERLIVGMRFTDPAYPRFHKTVAAEAEVGILDPLRNHLDELYPSTEDKVKFALSQTQTVASRKQTAKTAIVNSTLTRECTLTFLQRKGGHSRSISNFNQVMAATKSIFHEPKWRFQRVSFDGPMLMNQYLTIRNSMMFVSVSETGSHLAIPA